MPLLRSVPVLLVAAALAGCEPTTFPPVPVMVMSISNTGIYEPRPVQLTTVTDVIRLEGTAARLMGGARIVDDPTEITRQVPLTNDQLRDAIVKNRGLPPRASYVERDGVLWPADFHTWNMVSTYYNFEVAFRYFQENGFTTQETRDPSTGAGPTVFYFPDFILQGSPPLRDNALYFSPIQAFAVLPFDELQAVPLSMNSGIVAHEFAHLVFNKRVYGGASIPLPYSDAWMPAGGVFTATPVNVIRSIDEGLADFHAFGASCNTPFGCTTRFLEPSLGQTTADARDFARAGKCMDANLRNAINTLTFAQFIGQGYEYRLGTVLSAALYKASYPSRLQTLQQALIAAYDDDDANKPGIRQLIEGNAETPGNFTLPAVLISILQHITDPTLKTETCNAFMDYLQIPKEFLIAPNGAEIGCPNASVKTNDCPNIAP